MAQIRPIAVQQRRDEVYAALQYTASFHCLAEEWHGCEELKPTPNEKWNFVERKVEAKKHRMVWCAAGSQFRCMRCGRSSKHMKMPGKCEGPRWSGKNSDHMLNAWGRMHLGGEYHGEESGLKWRTLGSVQEVFGLCAVPSEAKADEPLQIREERHDSARENVENNPQARREGKDRNANGRKVEGEKKKSYQERVQEVDGHF